MPRIEPLEIQHGDAQLDAALDGYRRSLGFVPNSVSIMQRRPKLVLALSQLAAAVWDPQSTVDIGFKRLVAFVASRAHGCLYCQAHTAGAALRLGVDPAKLEDVWSYTTSPLFSQAERIALDFAFAAGSVPNAVDDEMFRRMRDHWSDDDIVEIMAVISLFGFMNRWNDTMGTALEPEAMEVGAAHLEAHGWTAGKHGEA